MDEIEEKKTIIITLLSSIEKKIEKFHKTPESQKDNYLKSLDKDCYQTNTEIEHFSDLLIKNQKQRQYNSLTTNFDQKIMDLEDRVKTLTSPPIHQTTQNLSNKESQNFTQAIQIDEGNTLLEEGKNRMKNAKNIMKRIGNNLDQIEEEIEAQRQKLLKTKDLIKDSQSLVIRGKKAVGDFAKLLRKDKWIKFLIILITIFIFLILAGALKIKYKRIYGYKRGKEKLEKYCLKSEDFEFGYWEIIDEEEIQRVDEVGYFDFWQENNKDRVKNFKNVKKKYKEFNKKCLGLICQEMEL